MALAAIAAATALGYPIAMVQSNASQNWVARPGLTWGPDFPSTFGLTVNRSVEFQKMIGFGGALTDSTAWNVMVGMNGASTTFTELGGGTLLSIRDFLQTRW